MKNSTKNKNPKSFLKFLIWLCIALFCLLILSTAVSANAEDAQTETRYIYGTCVPGNGTTNGASDWTYGVVSSRKYYGLNPLASDRANTYWVLPQGYVYYPSSSIGDTGGYSYSIPTNSTSLSRVDAGVGIDATSSTVYVIYTSKSGICSAINFSYEYVLSDEPDNPGTDDPDNPGTDDPDNPGTDDPDNPGTDEPVNPPYPSSEHSLDDIYEIMAATNDITVYETEAEFMAAEHNLSFYQTMVLRYLKELVTAVCCVCGLLLIILFTGRRKKD